MYCMPELATAVQHNIGVITIVFNNNAFGNVRRDQLTQFDGRLIGADLVNPDLVKLADSFGVTPYRVRVPDELRTALSKAIDEDVPALIECRITRTPDLTSHTLRDTYLSYSFFHLEK